MNIKDFFSKKKDIPVSSSSPASETEKEPTKETTATIEATIVKDTSNPERETFERVTPKNVGKLDMVIAFDTTGSMASYIDSVRKEVSDMIPELFQENEDLRLGIVAFGDYCDMKNARDFGDAYQCIDLTDNENDLIKFVRESRDTSGGDGDEFYELVIKKIVEETSWRKDSHRAILLISDATPHPLGYTFNDNVIGNQIDWRKEAAKAAENKIKIDTVTIHDLPWQRQLSEMTNGVSVPFKTGSKTANLVRASVRARGSLKSRTKFDHMMEECNDEEMKLILSSYKKSRDTYED